MIQPELRAQFRSQHLDSKHTWDVAADFQVMTDPRQRLQTTHQHYSKWRKCLRETEVSKVFGSPLQTVREQVTSAFSASSSLKQVPQKPRVRRPEDDTEQLCHDIQPWHGQKTSLTHDFFPELAIVQIKLWESGNKLENLWQHTLPAKICV